MIFKKKEEKLEPYSVDQCTQCDKNNKRKFKEGDYVFKIIEKCNSCGMGNVIIAKIFSEPIK